MPPRLFFPDEPAVPPPPPRPGPPPPPRPGPGAPGPAPQDQAPQGQAPGQGQALPHGQAPDPGQAPPAGQYPAPGQYPDQAPPGPPPFPGQPAPPPGPAGAPGPSRQRRARPTALPRKELRQRALAATVFGLLSLFALSAAGQVAHALYLVAFAFVVAVVAIVAGASASRRARREETARPRGSLAAVILGSLAVFLCAVSLIAVVFASQFAAYETCISNSPSSAAKQACATKFMQAIQKQVNGQGG